MCHEMFKLYIRVNSLINNTSPEKNYSVEYGMTKLETKLCFGSITTVVFLNFLTKCFSLEGWG